MQKILGCLVKFETNGDTNSLPDVPNQSNKPKVCTGTFSSQGKRNLVPRDKLMDKDLRKIMLLGTHILKGK